MHWNIPVYNNLNQGAGKLNVLWPCNIWPPNSSYNQQFNSNKLLITIWQMMNKEVDSSLTTNNNNNDYLISSV